MVMQRLGIGLSYPEYMEETINILKGDFLVNFWGWYFLNPKIVVEVNK